MLELIVSIAVLNDGHPVPDSNFADELDPKKRITLSGKGALTRQEAQVKPVSVV